MDRDREQPTILLVDDDVELCQMMAEFLGHHDVRVSTVHDGRSGLGAALKTRWDLVILDVMLPVIDGFEVLRQMRRRTTVPVIMLTARAEQRDRVAGLEEGADDYDKTLCPSGVVGAHPAVLRRAGLTGAIVPERRVVAFGELRLDVDSREVRCRGTRSLRSPKASPPSLRRSCGPVGERCRATSSRRFCISARRHPTSGRSTCMSAIFGRSSSHAATRPFEAHAESATCFR